MTEHRAMKPCLRLALTLPHYFTIDDISIYLKDPWPRGWVQVADVNARPACFAVKPVSRGPVPPGAGKGPREFTIGTNS
jgi:hypothetical protein